MAPSTPSTCRVLQEDPELAEGIPAAEREQAAADCIAPVITVKKGMWDGGDFAAMPDAVGLLVLDGLLLRRVQVSGRSGAELLGEGDLMRPWQGDALQPELAQATGWRVLSAARLAVLDFEAARRMARYPQLIGRLVGRAFERSRSLAVSMAIVNNPRVEVRLHVLFWRLASRWGHVRPDGVALNLPLSHAVLADLIGARRPTVTTALSDLARRGLIRRDPDGWLLRGDMPTELLDLRELGAAPADE